MERILRSMCIWLRFEGIILFLVLVKANAILSALCRGDAESQKARDALRKVTFDLASESEGEDVEDILGGKSKDVTKSETKSMFEKRQEKVCYVGKFMVWGFFFLHWRHMVYGTNK